MNAIFDNQNAEKCFRTWRAEELKKLQTWWGESAAWRKETNFDKFCLAIYTGRIEVKNNSLQVPRK